MSDDRIRWCNDKSELLDFISLVSVYAPDEFPQEEDELLDLDRAFEDLEYGLRCSEPEIADPTAVIRCRELFGLAYASFKSGDDSKAAKALFDAESLLGGV